MLQCVLCGLCEVKDVLVIRRDVLLRWVPCKVLTAQQLFSRWCILKASFFPVSVALLGFLLLPVNLRLSCGCER